MALIYDAELTPSKPQLLAGWVPRQPWFAGDAVAKPEVLGSYRFDDPAGEVGIETILVRFGDGPALQAPLTYRGAPLEASSPDTPGATPISTMEHSVLGRRWVYDGADDPVYLDTIAAAIRSGGTEAKLLTADGSELPSRGRVTGSGPVDSRPSTPVPGVDDTITTVALADATLLLRRQVTPLNPAAIPAPHLSGTWRGSEQPTVLAILRPAR